MEEKITHFSAIISITVDLHIISQLLVNQQFNLLLLVTTPQPCHLNSQVYWLIDSLI